MNTKIIYYQCADCGDWYEHDNFYLLLTDFGYLCYGCKGRREAQTYAI